MKYRKKLVLFSLFAMNLIEQPTPPVVIEQGILTGIVNNDGMIFEYIGIPYGIFNSSNRFQAPYPPPRWEGTLKATEQSMCPQYIFYKTWGVEDCLKVNVYVPSRATNPIPVMVFIHGGGFVIGDGGKLLYGPEFLVRHDVILVTFNYRLDILGFLCLGLKEAPGNAALRDQIAALKWVKKNIAAFGGDPENITVFGQSSGGVAVALLHASKATNGLFDKVIVQSGSSIANWAVNLKPVWVASIVAKELGHAIETPRELYELFSQLSYQGLLGIWPRRPLKAFIDSELLQLPCVERNIPGIEPVIDDLPYNLLRENPKNIPIMFSTLNKEGLYMQYFENDEKLEEKKDLYLFASDLAFPNDMEADKASKTVKKFYFGTEKCTMEMKDNITDYCTQYYFEIPTILETEIILGHSTSPVYNLIFEYAGGRNFMKYKYGFHNEEGAFHGDDLLYLFNARMWLFPINKADKLIINHMTKFYTNFAKFGDPTPSSSKPVIKWEPSVKGTTKFLYVDDKLRMGSMPNPEAYNMWKSIYQRHRRKDLEHFMP